MLIDNLQYIPNSVGSNPVHGFEVRDFWRIRSSILVNEHGFGWIGCSAQFWLNNFEDCAFCRGSKEFEVWFWWMNLGLSLFEV